MIQIIVSYKRYTAETVWFVKEIKKKKKTMKIKEAE